MTPTTRPQRGTIAIEEAVLPPSGLSWLAPSATIFNPSASPSTFPTTPLTLALLDIHAARLAHMDAHGVEYMLLSVTSPGAQGEPDPVKAAALAREANDWLAGEVARNPGRFGAFAAVSMHNAKDAVGEMRRAVRELGMKGVMVNDWQTVGGGKADREGRRYYDEEEYREFWGAVEELGVPVYLHPRYPGAEDLVEGTKYGGRRHLLGAAVQFHLDLSMHLYAICSSGVFDEFPKVQVLVGHLGEG